jgi:hypothetical protein
MGPHGVSMGLAWGLHGAAWGWHGVSTGLAWGMGLAWGGMGSHGVGMGRMGPHGDKPTGPLLQALQQAPRPRPSPPTALRHPPSSGGLRAPGVGRRASGMARGV